jgi:hypothetical protein
LSPLVRGRIPSRAGCAERGPRRTRCACEQLVQLPVPEDRCGVQRSMTVAVRDPGIRTGGEQAFHLTNVAAYDGAMEKCVAERALVVRIADRARHTTLSRRGQRGRQRVPILWKRANNLEYPRPLSLNRPADSRLGPQEACFSASAAGLQMKRFRPPAPAGHR